VQRPLSVRLETTDTAGRESMLVSVIRVAPVFVARRRLPDLCIAQTATLCLAPNDEVIHGANYY
jgi:hypothetical protein